jgi:hypothetical protein
LMVKLRVAVILPPPTDLTQGPAPHPHSSRDL